MVIEQIDREIIKKYCDGCHGITIMAMMTGLSTGVVAKSLNRLIKFGYIERIESKYIRTENGEKLAQEPIIPFADEKEINKYEARQSPRMAVNDRKGRAAVWA